MTHPVPEAAFDKHVALLGMTGAGKTSVIKTAIVEPDLEADRRVLIITPKDDWWGLRLSKSGKSEGFNIPIFGGRHEDYPLQVKDAALLAETYGTMKGSAIFCTSRLSTQDRARWFAAFAEKLLTANRGWVRVVIDEAHVFMPKQGAKGGGAVPAALHAGNELVSQGRSGGLRIVLASQRSAKLHNDALTQCSCLIAMLLMAPHDRDAVKDWIADQADPERGKEIIASLATLDPGQAWVWAPGAKFLERVQFARPGTFDSSAAPDDCADAEHRLNPINLDALKGKLATVEAEAKANDPKALRAENVALKKQIEDLSKATPAADPEALARAEERGFERGKKEIAAAADKRIREARLTDLEGLHDLVAPFVAFLEGEIKRAKADKAKIAQAVQFTHEPTATLRAVPSAPSRSPSYAKPAARNGNGAAHRAPGDGSLKKAERLILTALAQYPEGRTKNQVAILTGYAVNGGGFNNALSALRSAGRLDGSGDWLRITEDGLAALGDFDPLPHGAALLQHWMGQLGKAERSALEVIAGAYPAAISKDAVAEQSGYAADGGGFNNALSRLRTFELIEGKGDLRASDALFG